MSLLIMVSKHCHFHISHIQARQGKGRPQEEKGKKKPQAKINEKGGSGETIHNEDDYSISE